MKTNLLNILRQAIIKQNLPGEIAHNEMRPILLEGTKTEFNKNLKTYQQASVLIAIYPEQNKLVFPLIKRTIDGTVHSGQIAFPGGRKDENESNIECALRESKEELGIIPEKVEILGELSLMPIPPSQYLVTPIIGVLKSSPHFIPCPIEVEDYVIISLNQLIDPKRVKSITRTHRGAQYKIPYYDFNNEMVWGATAMILSELKQILIRDLDS